MAVIAVLIGAWWLAVIFTHSAIFPTPWDVVTGTAQLVGTAACGAYRRIAHARWVPASDWPSASAFRWACGWDGCASAYRTLNPLFQILRPISPIAWIPIAILWFGVGDASPIYLIFISSVFPMIVQTVVGVHTIEKRYLRAAENFGVSHRTLFMQVVIPAVLPADL